MGGLLPTHGYRHPASTITGRQIFTSTKEVNMAAGVVAAGGAAGAAQGTATQEALGAEKSLMNASAAKLKFIKSGEETGLGLI
jgi:hypothetical protein